MLDYRNYRIVWNSTRGKGHLLSMEANNLVCSRGGRTGELLIGRALHVETVRPERIAKITCSKCRARILKFDSTFLSREL